MFQNMGHRRHQSGKTGNIDHSCPVCSEQSVFIGIIKSLFADIETLTLASLSSPPWRIGSGIGCSVFSGISGRIIPERGALWLRIFHLKVKSFWGTTLNAVKIQVYSAIIAYCLVALVRNKLKVDRSTYEILQILSISLLDKSPLNELLTNQNYKDVKELYCNQLKINWI